MSSRTVTNPMSKVWSVLEAFFNLHGPNTGMRSIDQFEFILVNTHSGAEQVDADFELPILFYHKNGVLVAYYDLECHNGFINGFILKGTDND